MTSTGMSMDCMGEESGRSSLTAATRMELEEGRKRTVVSQGTKSKDVLRDLGELGEQLLPGIPNEITVRNISPKLPWRAFQMLSSVSRGWQKVIQSRLVYEARVCAQTTETLVVLNHNPSGDRGGIVKLALYSVIDNSWYNLPAIPHLLKGLPRSCQRISLGGKIYILGGYGDQHGSNEVYALDLAGQGEWTQCARMREPRQNFACGVVDGKIYVFGGTHGREYVNGGAIADPVCGSEVYDPKTNTWSAIQPMGFMRCGHRAVANGGELYVYGGVCYIADYFEKKANGAYNRMVCREPTYGASFLSVYHPARNEWKAIKKFGRRCTDRVFLAGGKFYLMSHHGRVYVHDKDMEKGLWQHLHSVSPAAVGATLHTGLEVVCPLVVNDELLAIFLPDRASKRCLFKGKGLGGENKEMVWDKANCLLRFDGMRAFMCPIQL